MSVSIGKCSHVSMQSRTILYLLWSRLWGKVMEKFWNSVPEQRWLKMFSVITCAWCWMFIFSSWLAVTVKKKNIHTSRRKVCVCAREPPYEPNPPTSDRCSAPAVAAPLIVLSNGCLASVTGASLLCAAPMCLPQEEVEAAAGCGAYRATDSFHYRPSFPPEAVLIYGDAFTLDSRLFTLCRQRRQ